MSVGMEELGAGGIASGVQGLDALGTGLLLLQTRQIRVRRFRVYTKAAS